jgi:PepSY-associated TM region
MNPSARLRVSKVHRLLGLAASVPIVLWILSSLVLHSVGLAQPNGLQGVYELEPYGASDVRLDGAGVVEPSEILRALSDDGVARIYWLRLEALGGLPVYVVKPGPFELERVYDARTAERIDPLPEELVRKIADAELRGTRAEQGEEIEEFNRYYTVDEVPAVEYEMVGDQPTRLVVSRASGRTLRRTDPLAEWFDKAYKSVHVWQWGDSMIFFTSFLYGLVGFSLVLVVLGYTMWWDRRVARKRWTKTVRTSRRLHARFAPVAGFLLATQMLVGAYLWFNLGLIEPRFRGQGSFESAWTGGIETTETLADAATIAAALPPDAAAAEHPIQRFEWRAVGGDRLWIAYPARNANGVLLDVETGAVLDRLTPEQARAATESVVQGVAVDEPLDSEEYWMDFNARVPTYLFRFTDPDDTDVYVSQITGEVVQRRPAIWRAFGPFLAYHTFGFTQNPWVDTVLLLALQGSILMMVFTGLRMALSSKKRKGTASA